MKAMIDNIIRILNFDNSVTNQRDLLSQYKTEIIDLTDLGPSARIWADLKTKILLERRLGAVPANCAVFTGSGDYHHASEILIGHYKDPLSVIVFDHHPDWSVMPPRFGCGSWVTGILRRENVKKVILIGVSSDNISTFGIQMGNTGSLRNDRVEIYPYSHAPARVFLKRVPNNGSVKIERSVLFDTLYWNELKDMDLGDFMRGMLARLPTDNVYISIDKDCLTADHAMTNWQEGLLPLEGLLLMLKAIRLNTTIAGFDVTGEYSPAVVKGIVKRAVSHFNHPRNIKSRSCDRSAINSVNENTNLKIAATLIGN